MKIFINKDILEGHNEAVSVYRELENSLGEQRTLDKLIRNASELLNKARILKDHIQNSECNLESFYPNFNPDQQLGRDNKFHRALDWWNDLSKNKMELSRLEAQGVPDREAVNKLRTSRAEVETKITDLRDRLRGFVEIEVSLILDPEEVETKKQEQREAAKVRGHVLREG